MVNTPLRAESGCCRPLCLGHLCQGFLWQQLHSSLLLVLPWVRILIAAVRILCTTTYHYCCCVEESCLGPGLPRILMASACILSCFTASPGHLLGQDSYGSSLHSSVLLVLPWVRILLAAACIHLCSWGLLCQGFLWQQLHSELLQ